MIETMRSSRGAVSAPHHLAAQAGLRVLREGGNAIEAMVATAAAIAASSITTTSCETAVVTRASWQRGDG